MICRLVEFALGLPDTHKVGGGERKRVLRAVARRALPASVVGRTDKIGFGTPDAEWVAGPLCPSVAAAAVDVGAQLPDLVDRESLFAFADAYHAGPHRQADALFRVLALRSWLDAYDVRSS